MSETINNEHCRIAARILETEPDLLDYRLVKYLNSLATMVNNAGGHLNSRQVIALAIIQWQQGKADDFTKLPQT